MLEGAPWFVYVLMACFAALSTILAAILTFWVKMTMAADARYQSQIEGLRSDVKECRDECTADRARHQEEMLALRAEYDRQMGNIEDRIAKMLNPNG